MWQLIVERHNHDACGAEVSAVAPANATPASARGLRTELRCVAEQAISATCTSCQRHDGVFVLALARTSCGGAVVQCSRPVGMPIDMLYIGLPSYAHTAHGCSYGVLSEA